MPYKNKEDKKAHNKAYRLKYPWYWLFHHARQRCEDVKHRSYKYCGALGIKFRLTMDEVEYLFNFGGGAFMKCPSLDRKDATKDYTFDNCRVIEKAINERLPHDPVLAEKWSD